MKIALVFILALVCSQAVSFDRKLTKDQKNSYGTLRESKTWAGFFVRLAEVQVMTNGGPLDELVGAIQDALEELAMKRAKADEAFNNRTNEHLAEVSKLESAISNTETQIAEIGDTLELLAQQKSTLQEEIKEKTQENSATALHMSEATASREMAHEAYQTHCEEYEEGLGAVEECLALLNNLANGASFAQVQKVKESLSKVHATLKNSRQVENHILLALVEMAANQEFADGGAIQAVVVKFQEIQANLMGSLAKAHEDEEFAQKEFDQDIKDCNNSINQNNMVISEDNDALVVNAQNTDDNNMMLALRNKDLVDFNDELDAENESYANDKEIYEDLCAQFDMEVAACQEALSVLAGADFADYISDRVMAEDGLVSSGMATAQQHGAGTEVFDFDYQL